MSSENATPRKARRVRQRYLWSKPLTRYESRTRLGDYQRKRGRVPITDPIGLGTMSLQPGRRLAREFLQVGHLTRPELAQVIVPPVEPTPKKGRELSKLQQRTNDVETFRTRDQFAQFSHNRAGLLRKLRPIQFPGIVRAGQETQLVDQGQACQKNGHFRRVQQKLRIPLSLRTG